MFVFIHFLILIDSCSQIPIALFIILVYRLLSYYSNSMQTLKAFLVFGLILYSSEQQDPGDRPPFKCKTAKECYDIDNPEKYGDSTVHSRVCSAHWACRCIWQCWSRSLNNCEIDMLSGVKTGLKVTFSDNKVIVEVKDSDDV